MKHAHSGPIRVQAEAPRQNQVIELLLEESLHLLLKDRITSDGTDFKTEHRTV